MREEEGGREREQRVLKMHIYTDPIKIPNILRILILLKL